MAPRAWRGARAVEWDGLENRCGPCGHRGFESHPLRQLYHQPVGKFPYELAFFFL